MVSLFNLEAARLGYSLFPKTKRFVVGVGDLKPSDFDFSLQSLILCRHFVSEISQTDHDFTVNYLINSCGLSPEGAISASKRVKLRSPERADSVLSFLRSHGFSATQISKLIRSRPQLLVGYPEKTLLPKLEFFMSIGISREELAKTFASVPALLDVSLQKRIKPTCLFLGNLLSGKNFVAFLKNGSRIFLEGHSKNLTPNIGILRELGMPQSCISLLLAHFPSCLIRNPENFGKVVDEVKQMGFHMEKTISVAAIKALCSSNSKSIWNRNSEVYKRWGWSENDVLSAFKRFPQCMTTSEKKIMQVMEFLVNKMEWPAGVINKYPIIVLLSLEKRIIPRCSVIKVLMVKGFMKEIENVSLFSVMCPVEKCFLAKFVARYIDEVPALLSVYQGKVEVQDA